MADVSHKNLTGTDLHEPKGVASASDGEVYIADGAASGGWAPKGPLYAILEHRTSNGVAPPSPGTASTWNKETLTEQTDPDNIVTVSASVFTLQAGTYRIKSIKAFGYETNHKVRTRIRNTSDSATVGLSFIGTSDTSPTSSANFFIEAEGVVTIASAKTFELQYFTTSTDSITLGRALGLGTEDEIYARVTIEKIK